jgi:SAM-dependent methyltransferase
LGYYEELYAASGDLTRRAAWRHRAEQALRFEAALDVMPARGAGARVLDVGCGPGGLLTYMTQTGRAPGAYLGLDALDLAVEAARSAEPTGRFVRASWPAWSPDVGEVWEEVVGIGCAVDGEARRGAAGLAHVEALLARMCEVAARGVCLVVLSQEAVASRPALASEPALIGLTGQQVAALVARLAARYGMRGWWREDVLTTDRVVYLRRAYDLHQDRERTEDRACDIRACGDKTRDVYANGDRWALQRRVLAGPWGEGMGPEERAWYWLEVGSAPEARAALEGASASPRVALLWERLHALEGR